MSAVIWEDILKNHLAVISENHKAMITRGVTLLFGLVCTALAYVVWLIGGNLTQVRCNLYFNNLVDLILLNILYVLFNQLLLRHTNNNG